MNVLVVYDSNYGNTKIIADAIAQEFSTQAVSVSNATDIDFSKINLLIAGSPINGWKPSEKMGIFLSNLKNDALKNCKAAAFDTRVKLFIHGDAANKIAHVLENAGAKLITKPQAFYVKGKDGPLLTGEKDKAVEWAKQIKMEAGE